MFHIYLTWASVPSGWHSSNRAQQELSKWIISILAHAAGAIEADHAGYPSRKQHRIQLHDCATSIAHDTDHAEGLSLRVLIS